jgi:hypothetical protein
LRQQQEESEVRSVATPMRYLVIIPPGAPTSDGHHATVVCTRPVA